MKDAEKKFPLDAELAYSKSLNKFVDEIEKKFKEIFLNEKNPNLKKNSEEGLEWEFLNYFEELITTEYATGLCLDYILEAIQYTVIGINNEITSIVGVEFYQAFVNKDIISKIVQDNVALIKAEPSKYLRTYDKIVEKLVKDKVEKGLTLKDLSEAIQKVTGIEKNRADLIAADQIGNVYSQVTKFQFEGIGLERFRWVTVGDKRVRPEHQKRNLKIYTWANPPDGEIPGGPIRCRCVAVAVKADVLKLLG